MTSPESTWQDRALCAEVDADMFFPDSDRDAAAAVQVCSRCDVRRRCLEYAISNDVRYGVWGGLTERDRDLIRKLVNKRVSARHAQTA